MGQLQSKSKDNSIENKKNDFIICIVILIIGFLILFTILFGIRKKNKSNSLNQCFLVEPLDSDSDSDSN